MARRPTTIYEHAVDISMDYLGPAGERFLRRQISTHLDKKPEDLTQKDLGELVSWVKLTFALLTDDKQMIDTFSDRLSQLAERKPQRATKTNTH